MSTALFFLFFLVFLVSALDIPQLNASQIHLLCSDETRLQFTREEQVYLPCAPRAQRFLFLGLT